MSIKRKVDAQNKQPRNTKHKKRKQRRHCKGNWKSFFSTAKQEEKIEKVKLQQQIEFKTICQRRLHTMFQCSISFNNEHNTVDSI